MAWADGSSSVSAGSFIELDVKLPFILRTLVPMLLHCSVRSALWRSLCLQTKHRESS
jgi:hypothetical protein